MLLAVAALVPALAGAQADRDHTPSSSTAPGGHAIRFKFAPGRTIYYVIEDELSDGASISGDFPLAYSDKVADRRTIVQSTTPPPPASQPLPPATQPDSDQSPAPSPASAPVQQNGRQKLEPRDEPETPQTRAGIVAPSTSPDIWSNSTDGKAADGETIHWLCDRFYAKEIASFRPDVAFDSVRDSYPVAALRGLGTTPGATAAIMISPSTGRVESVRVTPGPTAGPPTREKLSNTAARCAMTASNVQELIYTMGGYFFPDNPVSVGETWHRSHTDTASGVGTIVTDLACTLRSVEMRDGAELATIELNGKLTLLKSPAAAGPQARPTTRPTTRPRYPASRPTTLPAAHRSEGLTNGVKHPKKPTTRSYAPRPVMKPLPTTNPAMPRTPTTQLSEASAVRVTTIADASHTSPDGAKPPPDDAQVRPTTTARASIIESLTTRPAGRQIAPATQPTPPPQNVPATQPKDDERVIDRAVCTGNVIFDITHGELVSMDLRRELEVHKSLANNKPGQKPIEARQNTSHTLRIQRHLTAPPKPFIQGGPQPPEEPDAESASEFPGRKKPAAATQPASRPHATPSGTATRPAGARSNPQINLRESPDRKSGFRPAPTVKPRGASSTRPAGANKPSG